MFTEIKNRANRDEPVRIPSLPDLNKTQVNNQTPTEEEQASPAWRRPGSFRNRTEQPQPPKNLTLRKYFISHRPVAMEMI